MDHRIDRFPLVAGLVAVLTSPLMLWQGERIGWCVLLFVTGIVLLVTYWLIAHDVAFEPITQAQIVMALVGVACSWVAVIYLTRAADDLPEMFPRHSSGSEHYRLLPGIVMLVVGVVLVGAAIAQARPHRQTHPAD